MSAQWEYDLQNSADSPIWNDGLTGEEIADLTQEEADNKNKSKLEDY